MHAISQLFPSHRTRPLSSTPSQTSLPSLSFASQNLRLLPKPFHQASSHAPHTHHRISSGQETRAATAAQSDDGIPIDHVKILAKFKSRHNLITVLEVSRRADHPFAGSRLLLLDAPGNIHSISFLLKLLTGTYFDIFATLPPILPPGPIGIFGFGAGSAARLILRLYPTAVVHGWELDPCVISVGREYFGLTKLEKQNPDRLFIYIGDALKGSLRDGLAGILVDLFCRGSLVPELQELATWKKMKKSLRQGGRIMVNCGGSCVEAEDPVRDGNLIKEQTLRVMSQVFDELFVLDLGSRKEDSCIALTGDLPDLGVWKEALPKSLRGYVDMWLYPTAVVHGWELDPCVISVGKEYIGLSKLEKQNPDRLFIYIGDALKGSLRDGFAGILVDLFCKGSLVPELQELATWKKMKKSLRQGGRIMVNCGGSCVEAEDPAFDELFVLDLGSRKEDSCIALTGDLPDLGVWKEASPKSLGGYVGMWVPFTG
ncbi:hypothetical protein ACLOJK_001873 [Asimina triloba]